MKSYLKQENVATQHYLVWIRLQHKIFFVTSFTFTKWLKKYNSMLYLVIAWKEGLELFCYSSTTVK